MIDMWSDPNLTPFMAITSHWIEVKEVQTSSGVQQILQLRANLIGFHRVPGHHSGTHLAHTFKFVVDCLGITHKVCVYPPLFYCRLTGQLQIGWVTLDNASNNDTMMGALEEELQNVLPHLKFDRVENCIRFVTLQFVICLLT
jgi:hypothetical protein